MKKIGLICLAVVLALGGLGIGFAHWDDQLYINGEIQTGEVLIGFVWQETDDDEDIGGYIKAPDVGLDPVNLTQVPECAPCPESDKDVAETTCELLYQRKHCDNTLAEHEGMPQYEKLHITMKNVYPWYNPSVYFDIANCGSIPVIITGARVIMTSVNGVETAVDIPLPKCEPVQVDLDGDGDDDIAIGFTGPPEPQQIDPCDVAQFDLHFCFKDGTDPVTGESIGLDECTDYDFEIKIDAIQWNKA